MYTPPIKLYEAPMQAIVEARENAIFAQIQANFHVDVDKDELVRALQYDRGQYDKGYEDGKAAAAPEWFSVKEKKPEPFVSVLVHIPSEAPLSTLAEGYYGPDGYWYAYGFNNGPVAATHWTKMPEPPKEA